MIVEAVWLCKIRNCGGPPLRLNTLATSSERFPILLFRNTLCTFNSCSSNMSVPNAAVPRTFRCFIHSRTQLERCMFSTTRRGFASSAITKEEVATESTKASPPLAPALVSTQRDENWPLRSGLPPIGSRRRRAALRDSPNLPFEQLPYQCFQEARKVLAADREEKLKQIELQRARIARLLQQDATVSGGEFEKQRRLTSMRKHLEELKILADINDPAIRKRFQDGEGTTQVPRIYLVTCRI